MAAVPFSGSIIGTRRSGSSPRSKTNESQLAVTTWSGNCWRHVPRNHARVDRGGSVAAEMAASGVTNSSRPRRLASDRSGRRS